MDGTSRLQRAGHTVGGAVARRLPLPRDQYATLFFSLVVIYLATAAYGAQSIDTISTYYPAWQLAHHGNITMDAFSAERDLWFVQAGDRLVSNRFPGATWFATPFYLLDRGDSPGVLMGNLAAAVATAGAVTVLFALLRRLVETRVALAAALVVAFATPTWTVSGDALWTHGPGQLWLLTGVLLYAQRHHYLAGLAFGAAVLTRPHYAAVPAVIGAIDLLARRRLRPFLLVALGSGTGLALLLLYFERVFAVPDPTAGYGYGTVSPVGIAASSYLDRIAGTLVSPSRGVLVLTPFLLLLLPGMRSAWKAAPLWVRSAALAGTAYMLVQLRVNDWPGGYSFFSYRLAIEWLTLSTPLLVLAWREWTSRAQWRRRAFAVLVAYSLVTHAIGALLYAPEDAAPDYWTTWSVGVVVADRPAAATAVGIVALLVAALVAAAVTEGARSQVSQTELGPVSD